MRAMYKCSDSRRLRAFGESSQRGQRDAARVSERYFYALETSKEAKAFARPNVGVEESLALIQQREYIDEPGPEKYVHVREERIFGRVLPASPSGLSCSCGHPATHSPHSHPSGRAAAVGSAPGPGALRTRVDLARGIGGAAEVSGRGGPVLGVLRPCDGRRCPVSSPAPGPCQQAGRQRHTRHGWYATGLPGRHGRDGDCGHR
jgi:hypothetical protein